MATNPNVATGSNDPEHGLFSGFGSAAEQSSQGGAGGVSNPNVAKPSGPPASFITPVPPVKSVSGHPFQKVEPENVAANTSQTPMSFEAQVKTSYQLANAEQTHQNFSFGQQGSLAGQPPMASQGSLPGFTQLKHAAMPVVTTVPGTDYTP